MNLSSGLIPTIIILIIVAIFVVIAIIILAKGNGKCGCGCSECALKDKCHKKKSSKE